MSKKVVVISSSLRVNSNSEKLAESFAKGAREAGNEVEFISLKGKKLAFCIGCLTCQNTGHCVIKDDAVEIEPKVLNSDVVVFASPIYYYEMSGQLKTLLDRLNPMYAKKFNFREVYFLSTAGDDREETPYRALSGIKGWIECFEGVSLKGSVFCGDVCTKTTIDGNAKLNEAYEMGKRV